MFKGSMVALITPMKQGEVDVERLRQLVEIHIEAGTDVLVAAGTTGESGTLNHREKLLVIKTVIDQARERIPVVAGTSMNATRDCIQLTDEAMHLGAHAALIMTPAYIKPTQQGLVAHYKAIAESVHIPIILYNVPGRTAMDMLPETVAELSSISNIVGLKEASSVEGRLEVLLDKVEDRLSIFSGDDISCAEWMLNGAKGVISVTANIVPTEMAKMAQFAAEGQRKACLEINARIKTLHELMFIESNPIPVKWAAAQMGWVENERRLPMLPLSSEHHERLKQEMIALGLIS